MKKIVIGIVVVLVAVTGVLLLTRGDGTEPSQGRRARRALLRQKGAASAVKTPRTQPGAPRAPRPRASMSVATNKLGRVVRVMGGRLGGKDDGIFRDDDGKPYPAADQKIMRAAQEAIEKDDMQAALALANDALTSRNAELRGMVVDALGWFGKDALAELLPFMGDRDEDVAENARSQWMSGLQEIDDDGEKAGVVEVALRGLRNKDAVEDVMNELVGIDELAAVQVLVDVILEGKNAAAVAAAKETYNTITGDDFTDVDAAEAWLQENYEPDDDEPGVGGKENAARPPREKTGGAEASDDENQEEKKERNDDE